MMQFIVYEVWDLSKDEPFYVGKGRDVYQRRAQHLKEARRKRNGAAFHKKLRAMIEDNKPYEFRVVFETEDENEAFAEEIRLIASYGRRDIGTGLLLNHTDGGQGMSGRIYSEATRQRWSEIRKGRTPWCKGKTFKHTKPSPKKGKPWSDKQREQYDNRTPEQIAQKALRASLAHKGQCQTEAMRAAASRRMLGQRKGPDGKFYRPEEFRAKFGGPNHHDTDNQ